MACRERTGVPEEASLLSTSAPVRVSAGADPRGARGAPRLGFTPSPPRLLIRWGVAWSCGTSMLNRNPGPAAAQTGSAELRTSSCSAASKATRAACGARTKQANSSRWDCDRWQIPHLRSGDSNLLFSIINLRRKSSACLSHRTWEAGRRRRTRRQRSHPAMTARSLRLCLGRWGCWR